MSPFLSWIDHDPKARERSQQILSLFSEKESRDEMGMGTVRDALADLLFPGTSTIQTRLRYFLFIPWTYEALEHTGKQGDLFLAEGRKQELRLLDSFELEPKETGLIGSEARAAVKRLPSSVYWAGLQSWGIRRRFTGGMEEYARGFRSFHDRVSRLARHGGGDDEGDGPTGEGIWHKRVLELRPAGFPQSMSFRLTRDESDFLVDRIRGSHPESLLAWFALHPEAPVSDDLLFPWDHPLKDAFPAPIRETIEHGRLLSIVIEGAALLYNLQLAEVAERSELLDRYREDLESWRGDLDLPSLATWDLARLWEIAARGGGRPTVSTRLFLEAWLSQVLETSGNVTEAETARTLVRNREMALKQGRSRFRNTAARNQWQGGSGTAPMVYRWPQALRLLRDLER